MLVSACSFAPAKLHNRCRSRQRLALRETLREFLGRRPLDAALDRATFVTLGMKYLDEAERVESGT